MAAPSYLLDLRCTRCGSTRDADAIRTVCGCGGPLYARYDLDRAVGRWNDRPPAGRSRSLGLWRYAELLPVRDPLHRITLGEGCTPLLDAPALAEAVGVGELLLKDEGLNPTASFKARGLCIAVARARELGIDSLAVPTAGNAGGALAAYAARAGLQAHVYMPADTPAAFVHECRTLGARVVTVDGTIADAGAALAGDLDDLGAFPVSTLKEPYRIEGKKTLGFELAEALGWSLPDAVVYPTGGGTGLLGMWKAFEELESIGLLDGRRPRMIAVQSRGCAPLVDAFRRGIAEPEPWPDAETLATGLRVPHAYAGREILEVLRASEGDAVAVDDAEILAAAGELARNVGIHASPEAAATLAGLRELADRGRIEPVSSVALFLTASGYKYREVLDPEVDTRQGAGRERGA